MKKERFLYIFLILILTIQACTLKNRNKKIASIENEIEIILKKDLFVPSSLALYAPFSNDYNIDSLNKKTELKIFTSINVSCGSCFQKIPEWSDFNEKIKDFNVEIYLICKSDDNFELLKYMCESKNIKPITIPFYFDINNEYLQENSFMNLHYQYETVLTDLQNKILMVGNPTLEEQTEKTYIDFIRKFTSADK